MATISNNDIARAIYLISKDKSHHEQADVFKKVVNFLSRKRLLSKASAILLQLRKIINENDSRMVVKVSSVEKLTHQNKTHLEHTLKKRYGVKEIVFEENLDKNLIGGIKIEVNDEIIDLSIKNRIRKLQEYLIKGV